MAYPSGISHVYAVILSSLQRALSARQQNLKQYQLSTHIHFLGLLPGSPTLIAASRNSVPFMPFPQVQMGPMNGNGGGAFWFQEVGGLDVSKTPPRSSFVDHPSVCLGTSFGLKPPNETLIQLSLDIGALLLS